MSDDAAKAFATFQKLLNWFISTTLDSTHHRRLPEIVISYTLYLYRVKETKTQVYIIGFKGLLDQPSILTFGKSVRFLTVDLKNLQTKFSAHPWYPYTFLSLSPQESKSALKIQIWVLSHTRHKLEKVGPVFEFPEGRFWFLRSQG